MFAALKVVRVVDLIEVDDINAQTLKALFKRGNELREGIGGSAPGEVGFRRDKDRVPGDLLQKEPDDDLALSVVGRCIIESEAFFIGFQEDIDILILSDQLAVFTAAQVGTADSHPQRAPVLCFPDIVPDLGL